MQILQEVKIDSDTTAPRWLQICRRFYAVTTHGEQTERDKHEQICDDDVNSRN